MIPLLVPALPTARDLLPYLEQIDANRHYTNFGPLNTAFESRIRASLSTPGHEVHAVTMANCTLALELGLQSLGVGAGDRVLVPSVSFVATATAVMRIGAIPVFADVEADSWTLSVSEAVEASRHHALRAVVPVSTFGCALDAGAWDRFSADTGIPVLIDAAGAWGNQQVGATTDVAYSFHATKSFGIGEGGAVASSDTARIARLRRLSNFGLDTDRSMLVECGTNAKLSEYHSAVGLAAFDRWESMRSRRVAHMNAYVHMLGCEIPCLGFQRKDARGVYPILAVLLPEDCSVTNAMGALARAGVASRRWYCPALHEHEALAHCPRAGDLSVAEDLSSRLLGVPYFVSMSEAQSTTVVSALRAVLQTTMPTETHAAGNP